MILSQIFPEYPSLPEELQALEVGRPCMDLQALQKKDVFFSENSASYLKEAEEKGASVIVTRKAPAIPLSVPVFLVKNIRHAYALAWQSYTGHPEKELRLYAVTGTNGKSSVTAFLSSLLQKAGYRVGEVGTLRSFDGKTEEPSAYTTPPPEILYPLLARMKKNGVTHVVMEVSSHAIAQERTAGLKFAFGIFTNLTHDHLDYHKTFDAYKAAKASLFRQTEHSLICLDDPSAREIAFEAAGDVYYYGKSKDADFVIREPRQEESGISYILSHDGAEFPVSLPVFGKFQAENSAAAISAALLSGLSPETLKASFESLKAPAGRLEELGIRQPYRVFIDYAHTPDALIHALSSLRGLTQKLTVLFGAGGDRDRTKRPEMGSAAERLADRILLTSDNPRTEDPQTIIREIAAGIRQKTPILISDREKAIEYALSTAEEGEVILLAGKGHETYLIDRNGKREFSERRIVYNYLERKGQENVSQHE